ncbi:NAD(P)-dependent dehydrogenase, short-chain alcohol dehydrogenase family [Enhydrobacter aerosaccus]|uniref:NAD(P)-dependent dehydrogenase, short-chain alcohol dehydrogenase family n=1 Tax=Enhydrobacter aerosaccus TaxID=225324 RepID=A0A1T4L2Y8_9HYPH|nr:SDR family oxidoreductase [Enhydrobacter aerosaccus]SJZ49112.1 NAD(P)-dependent dehydrogenase, short-chain alcohol dehydrogenase family [Enhydrobacter aerosaccus]
MDLGLKGKRVLITGGTKSIGRAIVDAFVAEGAIVGFCARDAALVKRREDEWRAKQARVQGTALDVTDDPALKSWIDGFAAAGGLDHFVANVSALGTDDTPEGWRKSIEIDIVSTVESVRHAMPHLLKSGPGATCTVIGTVSLNEAGPGPVQPYRSVKAALVPFVKSLAIEMAPKGVRVNMVSPGSILEDGNTWGRQRDADSERYKRTLARNPMGRMGTPQEIAAPVVFLAGAPASFITGVNFIVDGAITTRVQY